MTWEKASQIATAVGVPVIVVGLAVTWFAYVAQTRATAANTFQEYLKVSLDPANARFIAPTDTLLLCDQRYQIYASFALLVGESITNLPGEGAAWKRTIEDLVRDQRVFVTSVYFPMDEYSAEYQRLVKRIVRTAGSRPVHCPT